MHIRLSKFVTSVLGISTFRDTHLNITVSTFLLCFRQITMRLLAGESATATSITEEITLSSNPPWLRECDCFRAQ
jgi:hypothetical protein